MRVIGAGAGAGKKEEGKNEEGKKEEGKKEEGKKEEGKRERVLSRTEKKSARETQGITLSYDDRQKNRHGCVANRRSSSA